MDGLLRTQQPTTHPTSAQRVSANRGRRARKRAQKQEAPVGVPVHKGRWAQPHRQASDDTTAVGSGSPARSRSSSPRPSTSTAITTPTSSAESLPPQLASAKDVRANEYYAAFYQGPPRLKKLCSQEHEEDPLAAMVQAGIERAMVKKGMCVSNRHT